MLHMAAYYYGTLLAADGLKALPPVSDTIFATSGTGLLLPTDLKLVGAYAGSTLILRARVNAPSFLRVGFPSIRPVMQNATSGAASADPNFMPLVDSPLSLKANEPVGVDAASSLTTTGEKAVALLMFADKIEREPRGEAFLMRFTTASTISTAQIGTWAPITPAFDQAFPSGTYAITGLEFTGPGAVAARVVLPGSLYRPGVLAQQGSLLTASDVGATRTAQCFYDGSFGIWGTFQTSAPPSLEVLAVTAAATGTMEGYLRVVRIGDVGASCSPPSGTLSHNASPSPVARR